MKMEMVNMQKFISYISRSLYRPTDYMYLTEVVGLRRHECCVFRRLRQNYILRCNANMRYGYGGQ